MKVLNVNMSLNPVTGGGTAERTFQISRALTRKGIDCEILTLVSSLDEAQINALKNVRLTTLKCLSERFYIPVFQQTIIEKAVEGSDIVHLMNHWTVINLLVYRVCRKYSKPYVVCPAGALSIFGRSRFFKRFYNYIIGNRLVANADGHIAISQNEIAQFSDYGIVSSDVTVIPNGIDPEYFEHSDPIAFRRCYGLNDQPFMLFVGRLNPIKGPDLLLQAYANIIDQLCGFHLVFTGPDGGLLDCLKKIVFSKGIEDRVHFTGYLGGVEKSSAYRAADLLVIPSRQEAMSIVVLEAGISGIPVLITDRCGFDEVTVIGGGMVAPASVEGLQQGLTSLIGDKKRLIEMGRNLKSYVNEHFVWDEVIKKYIDLYDSILN
jgi:glycosyltransferase involved in cell wall biosynthesis